MPPSANALRQQIESALAHKIPAALTPAQRLDKPRQPTGIAVVDEMLGGGLPLGAITEITGAECSGRTSLAWSYVAGVIRSGHVAAWIDASDAFDPESAAACGVDLDRLLWVRCAGAQACANSTSAARKFRVPEKYFTPSPPKRGLHGGGFGPHPREEVKGMADAVGDLLRLQDATANCERPTVPEGHGFSSTGKPAANAGAFAPEASIHSVKNHFRLQNKFNQGKPWFRLDQALRATDLLLQAGGFRALVLDMASIAPEHASRVPMATWFRYRAAAERTQSSFLLLTQHTCAKSSAGLVLRMQADARQNEPTLFAGLNPRAEIVRDRFAPIRNKVIPLRKPVQSERGASWHTLPAWMGPESA